MLTENKIFMWKCKTTAFWQNHGIHVIWRTSWFPWFPWLSTLHSDKLKIPRTESMKVMRQWIMRGMSPSQPT